MKGRRGLIMGVANDHSIAWGIAQVLYRHGAELAFTYQGEAFGRRVKPLAAKVGSSLVFPCDVEDVATVDQVFAGLAKAWGTVDFLVHAIAYSDKSELKGPYAATTRENFVRTMIISCFSFTEVATRAAALMPPGGAMLTLTYGGSTRVMPNYNVMGVAKAALEASVRYLAADFGPKGIRVNAISAGPMRTLAGFWYWRCPRDVQFPEASFAPPPHRHPRRCRRCRTLSSLLTFAEALRARSIMWIRDTTSSRRRGPRI